MHSFVVNRNIDSKQNGVYIKEHKNRIIFHNGDACLFYPLFIGVTYSITNNELICKIDNTKISNLNRSKLAPVLFDSFNKHSIDVMYNKSSKNDINECIEIMSSCIKCVYPQGYIPLHEGFFDNELKFKSTIKFKRKTIKGSVIITNTHNINELITNINQTQKNNQNHKYHTFTQHISTIKNLTTKVLIVTYNKIESIYEQITNSRNRPQFIWIMLTDEEFKTINHNKILCISAWDITCNHKRKGDTHDLIDLITVDSQTKSVEKLVNISRISIVPNIIERKVLNMNKYVLGDAVKALDAMSKFIYIKPDKNNTNECAICVTDKENVTTNCGHKLCLMCVMDLTMSSKKFGCPFCRTPVDINNSVIHTKAIPSRLYTINWIINKFQKPVVYMDNINDATILLAICNKRITTAKDSDIDTLNQNEKIIIICTENDIDKISKVKGIDTIVCKSDNNNIIKNKNAYGNDFINKTGLITLNLYSYNV